MVDLIILSICLSLHPTQPTHFFIKYFFSRFISAVKTIFRNQFSSELSTVAISIDDFILFSSNIAHTQGFFNPSEKCDDEFIGGDFISMFYVIIIALSLFLLISSSSLLLLLLLALKTEKVNKDRKLKWFEID
jgi:hypothetical protein